jgi:hypothetical protein
VIYDNDKTNFLLIPNIKDLGQTETSVHDFLLAFLGSLARVGWFPRQFRGIVSENPYEKRHIGSAARLGWVPLSSKWDRPEDGFGERGGFKRNIQSLRKANFAVQNQWERPQQ